MTYRTRVANPPRKKKATRVANKSTPAMRLKAAYTRAKRKKKGEPLTDLERKALAKYGGKKKTAKKKTAKKKTAKKKTTKKKVAKKKVAKKKVAKKRPSGRAAMYGKKAGKKKTAKKKVAKKKTAKKKTARASGASVSQAQLEKHITELEKLIKGLRKGLKRKDLAPADRRKMKADLKKAVTSNSACRLAAKRWGQPSPSCGRRHPLPKNYKGPKGPKQLGEYSTKTKWRGVPSLNNSAFWG